MRRNTRGHVTDYGNGERMRLTPTAPLVWVRWNPTLRRFQQRGNFGEPWRRIKVAELPVRTQETLASIRVGAE